MTVFWPLFDIFQNYLFFLRLALLPLLPIILEDLLPFLVLLLIRPFIILAPLFNLLIVLGLCFNMIILSCFAVIILNTKPFLENLDITLLNDFLVAPALAGIAPRNLLIPLRLMSMNNLTILNICCLYLK